MESNNERRQLRIRLPDNIWAQTEMYARSTNRSVNDVISCAVTEYLGKNTSNETLFVSAMNKLTNSFTELVQQEKYNSDQIESLMIEVDKMKLDTAKTEYNQRTTLAMMLDMVRYLYSLFYSEIDSKERSATSLDRSLNFLNDYLQEFIAFRNKHGTGFVKKVLETGYK